MRSDIKLLVTPDNRKRPRIQINHLLTYDQQDKAVMFSECTGSFQTHTGYTYYVPYCMLPLTAPGKPSSVQTVTEGIPQHDDLCSLWPQVALTFL